MAPINLLGTKIGMTQVFNNQGCVIPVTVLQIGPCFITQIKTIESDGYSAIQIGYLETKTNNLSQAEVGHLKKSGTPALRHLKEYRVKPCKEFKLGQDITTNKLKVGDLVDISGKSIGKGFTGYQKRHHFSRGPMSHGSKNHRQPGSISAGTTPGRVFPGKKMAGRMGGNKVTIKNLQIVDIHIDKHLVVVKGSVPGKPGSVISIKRK